ncbi:hypothetical protein CHUAL_002301 [Chamberlinius hualienensis]
MEYQFQVLDYLMVFILLFLPAAYGLYLSNVKHKQSTLLEYFLGGRNVSEILVIASYFSTFCAGGISGQAIEVYLFGSQSTAFILTLPVILILFHYLVVPVFYPLQNMSMLKYFEMRFGKVVTIIALIGSITVMVLTGSANIYVSAIIIQQVTAVSFWTAATIMTATCVVYSTLGGMRGVIVTDAIQAVFMIVAIAALLIIGVIKSGGIGAVWDINGQYDRLEFFNFNFDPTIRYTIWSAFLGFGFLTLCFNTINQSLLQRCIMASNMSSAQRISKFGISASLIYILAFSLLGLVIFSYYNGCNVLQTGKIQTINQVISYFTMEILYDYPTLPGIIFSGMLCSTMSTISSFLISIAALIVGQLKVSITQETNKCGTFLCKTLVVLWGLVMFSLLFIMEKFLNVAQVRMLYKSHKDVYFCFKLFCCMHIIFQAIFVFIAIPSGPAFAIYCIGILFPNSNSKCVAASYLVALSCGFYILLGSLLVTSKDLPKPFANCTFDALENITAHNFSRTADVARGDQFDIYFPLNKISFLYISLLTFLVTIFSFIFQSLIIGLQKPKSISGGKPFDLSLIPPCIQKFQSKLNRKWRKLLLCDVYDDRTPLSIEQQNMLTNINTTEDNQKFEIDDHAL